MKDDYRELLHLPHHRSQTHAPMPRRDRAAQFAPFAALTGYDSAIEEAGRLTEGKVELGEEALNALNRRYWLLVDALGGEPEVEITYFRPDDRKNGGAYLTVTGIVRKIDEYARLITMQDGTRIPMDDVLRISGGIFSALEQP